MSATAPNSKSYSILIDTDGKFGSSGPNADPDFRAGNPGFEIELVLATNFGVYIYDVNGPSATIVHSYPGHSNYQKSVALSTECGNPDYFYDFYVNFNHITAAFPSVTTSTPLRMVVIDNMAAQASSVVHTSSRSDLGGTDCHDDFDLCMVGIIDNYTPCPPGQYCPDRTACPIINGPIYTNNTTITGTSTEANGTSIKVLKNGILLGSTTVTSGVWTLNSVSGLITGDVITATAIASGKGESIGNCSSRTVLAGAVPCAFVPAPVITNVQAGKVVTISYSTSDNVITVYNADNNTIWAGVNNGLTSSSATSYDIGATNGINLPTNFYVVASNGACLSAKTFYCSSGLPSTTPIIHTPVIAGSTSISGTCGNLATSVVIIAFKGSTLIGTVSVTGTTWTISGLTLAINEQIFVTSKEGTRCMAGSSTVTVLCSPSVTPIVSEPVYSDDIVLKGTCETGATVVVYKNGTSIGNATVTGTTWSIPVSSLIANSTTFYAEATELNKCTAQSPAIAVRSIPVPAIVGTYCGATSVISGYIAATSGSVQLYNNSNVAIGSPVSVSPSGVWSVTGLSLSPGDHIYAKASWPNGSVSSPSATFLIGNITTNPVAITTNPIVELSSSISGTGVNGDVIKLYFEGFLTSYSATVNSSGIWQISGIPSYELFPGEEVYVTATSSGLCESSPSASKFVQCLPHADRSISASSTEVCVNSRGTVTVANSEAGIFYTPVLSDGTTVWGFTSVGTGSNLNLTTFDLTINPTVIKVRASKIPSNACDGSLSGSVSFTLNPLPVAPTAAANQTYCGTGSYTLADLTVTAPSGSVVDWYSLSVGGFLLPTSTSLVATTTYYAESRNSTTGCRSVNRTTVTVTSGTPSIPTASASQTFCNGATIADIVATLSSTGVIRWYSVAIGGSFLSSGLTLTDGLIYYAETYDGSCISSLPRREVTVTLVSDPLITVHPVSPTSVCIGGSLTALSVSASGGTPSLNYQWYSNTVNNNTTGTLISGATNSSYTPSTSIAGTTYYYCTVNATGGGCGTATSSTATVTILPLPVDPVSANVDRTNYCSDDTGTISLSLAGGSGATIQWFTSICAGTSVGVGNPLIIDSPTSTTTYFGRWENSCGSSNCASVTTIVIASPSTPTASNNGPVCAGSTLSLSTPTVSGATYSWTGPNSFSSGLQNPSITSTTTTASGTYSVTVTVNGCTSSVGMTTATVNAIPSTPTASNNGPVCAGSTLSLSTPTVSGA
ncbi:MAG: hypothetical protein Q8S54_19610, partial [Bacteroidota bacterium]|nr:hypothetical protein [Bacteroidota bacterium]